MLKKILLTFIILSGLSAFAADNFLNSVVIDNNDGSLSVVLRSDSPAKVKKDIAGQDSVVLTLNGITQSHDITALYKNASDVKGLVIQNTGTDEIKIFIDAPNISKADVIFETPDSAPLPVKTSSSQGRFLWTVVSIMFLFVVMRSAQNTPIAFTGNKDELIKEREKALYKNFQREIKSLPSMNYRLKSYSKHVLKGETIRSYENRTAMKV